MNDVHERFTSINIESFIQGGPGELLLGCQDILGCSNFFVCCMTSLTVLRTGIKIQY